MRLCRLAFSAPATAEIRRAWAAWRADASAVVVFRDWQTALGATCASGAGLVLFTAKHSDNLDALPEEAVERGNRPPRVLHPDEPRRICRLSAWDDEAALRRVDLFVLFVDGELEIVAHASGALREHLNGRPVALVCSWWPGMEITPSLDPLLGAGRRYVVDIPPLSRPSILRFAHSRGVSTLHRRLAQPHLQGDGGARAHDALRVCRSTGAAECIIAELKKHTRAVCVVESVSLRAVCKKYALHAYDKASLLSGCFTVPLDLVDEPVDLLFVVEFLIEYHERLVVAALSAAGLSFGRIEAHTWTVDGSIARVDGWAAAPPADLVTAGLKTFI